VKNVRESDLALLVKNEREADLALLVKNESKSDVSSSVHFNSGTLQRSFVPMFSCQQIHEECFFSSIWSPMCAPFEELVQQMGPVSS
jgi:hypothetical protein